MNVEIIAIGDELLIGQVIDTNSAWISQKLNEIGFHVLQKTITGDVEHDIISAIQAAKTRKSLVLLTGGLGPTKDDITLQALCHFFNCQLHLSEEVLSHIQQLFSKNGRTLNELTRNQAMVPDSCLVIQNQAGTAPCTWFEQDDFLLVSMPGVPFEMKWLMENEILPRLKKRFHRDLCIMHQTLWVSGYAESELAIRLTDFEHEMPSDVKLAYLPQLGIVRLRLSAYTVNEEEAKNKITLLQVQLEELLGEHIFAIGEQLPEVLIGEKLKEQGLTVCTAESCTGGAIASLLTSVPGSSAYFKGSVVAYANQVKQEVLGVSENDLTIQGAVSQSVVEQMAQGALRILETDFAIATSGIAGPGGETPEKPVGTIWIAVASNEKTISRLFHFHTNREQNIQRTVLMSLLLLLEELKKID